MTSMEKQPVSEKQKPRKKLKAKADLREKKQNIVLSKPGKVRIKKNTFSVALQFFINKHVFKTTFHFQIEMKFQTVNFDKVTKILRLFGQWDTCLFSNHCLYKPSHSISTHQLLSDLQWCAYGIIYQTSTNLWYSVA